MNLLKFVVIVLIALCSCEGRNLYNEDDYEQKQTDMKDTLLTDIDPKEDFMTDVDPNEDLNNDDFDQEYFTDFMEKYLSDKEKLMEDKSNIGYRGCTYIYHRRPVTFYEAEQICELLGGQVAYKNMLTPHDRQEVFNKVGHGRVNVWIGVRYAFGNWRTQNKKVIQHGSFGWNTGEPNFKSTEHCTENLLHNVYVNNMACYKKRSFICEFDAAGHKTDSH